MDYSEYLAQMQAMIEQNNQWSAQQAERQMQFQSDMSNTAHQREVMDLVAAGLNPVLSAHGQGASTPNGAMADNSGQVGAMAQMLSTIIDTENANARAALAAATRGSGSSTSAYGNSNFLTNLLMAFGMNRSQAQGLGNTVESLGGLDGIINWLTGQNVGTNASGSSGSGNTSYKTTTNTLASGNDNGVRYSIGAASATAQNSSTSSNKTLWQKITEQPIVKAVAKGLYDTVMKFTR